MYKIRKMPNREEYCIYGKKGKLYTFPTRQKAISKYYKLLDSFWVNNPGTMENPDISLFAYSENILSLNYRNKLNKLSELIKRSNK